jgi:hypothetical protein
VTFLACAFVSGLLFGFGVGLRIGKRRGADDIIDQMMRASFEAPDAVDLGWPRARREERRQ